MDKMMMKLEALKKIIDEMDNLAMSKMGSKEIPMEDDSEESPVKVKVMKIEAKPEDEEEDYSMESEDGEPIDMTPIKELRNRLRGK